MRKFVLVLAVLAAAMAFNFASCSADNDNSDSGNNSGDGSATPVSITATAADVAKKISERTSSISVTVTGAITDDTLTAINNALGKIYSNRKVYLDLSQTTGVTVLKGGTFVSGDLIECSLPSTVTRIYSQAFTCRELTKVTIPASVTRMGEDPNSSACGAPFFECTKLKSVTFENTNGWTVRYPTGYTSSGYAAISSSDLSNPTTAAKYLTSYSYYYDRIWIRSGS